MAVLTSAVRDSANGEEFAETVRTRYGLEPHVLSGDEEAQLTFLGATSERDAADRAPTLVLDIGGGSTEMIIGRRRGRLSRLHPGRGGAPDRAPPARRSARPGRDGRAVADVRAILEDNVPADQRGEVSHGIARGRDRHLAGGHRPAPGPL